MKEKIHNETLAFAKWLTQTFQYSEVEAILCTAFSIKTPTQKKAFRARLRNLRRPELGCVPDLEKGKPGIRTDYTFSQLRHLFVATHLNISGFDPRVIGEIFKKQEKSRVRKPPLTWFDAVGVPNRPLDTVFFFETFQATKAEWLVFDAENGKFIQGPPVSYKKDVEPTFCMWAIQNLNASGDTFKQSFDELEGMFCLSAYKSIYSFTADKPVSIFLNIAALVAQLHASIAFIRPQPSPVKLIRIIMEK